MLIGESPRVCVHVPLPPPVLGARLLAVQHAVLCFFPCVLR